MVVNDKLRHNIWRKNVRSYKGTNRTFQAYWGWWHMTDVDRTNPVRINPFIRHCRMGFPRFKFMGTGVRQKEWKF